MVGMSSNFYCCYFFFSQSGKARVQSGQFVKWDERGGGRGYMGVDANGHENERGWLGLPPASTVVGSGGEKQ